MFGAFSKHENTTKTLDLCLRRYHKRNHKN